MIRTAVIDIESELVTNIIEFEDEIPLEPLPGQLWVASDTAQIGWHYAAGVFTNPNTPAAPTTEEIQAAHYAACEAALHEHIYAKYPIPTQTTLLAIAQLAVKNEWSDVYMLVETAWTWINGCLALFYAHCSEPEEGVPDFSALSSEGLTTLEQLQTLIASKAA